MLCIKTKQSVKHLLIKTVLGKYNVTLNLPAFFCCDTYAIDFKLNYSRLKNCEKLTFFIYFLAERDYVIRTYQKLLQTSCKLQTLIT